MRGLLSLLAIASCMQLSNCSRKSFWNALVQLWRKSNSWTSLSTLGRVLLPLVSRYNSTFRGSTLWGSRMSIFALEEMILVFSRGCFQIWRSWRWRGCRILTVRTWYGFCGRWICLAGDEGDWVRWCGGGQDWIQKLAESEYFVCWIVDFIIAVGNCVYIWWYCFSFLTFSVKLITASWELYISRIVWCLYNISCHFLKGGITLSLRFEAR